MVIFLINYRRLPLEVAQTKKGTFFELCLDFFLHIYVEKTVVFCLTGSEESLELRYRQNQSRLMPTLHLSQAVVDTPLPIKSNER